MGCGCSVEPPSTDSSSDESSDQDTEPDEEDPGDVSHNDSGFFDEILPGNKLPIQSRGDLVNGLVS